MGLSRLGSRAPARLRRPALLLGGGLLVLAGAVALGRSTRWEKADFTFNNSAEVTSLDPHTITGVPESRIMNALGEGLVRRSPHALKPVPALAERWEVSEDGLEHVFHLRSEARWSNGEPLTAADFVYSFRRLLDPATGAEYAYLLHGVEGARAFSTGSFDDPGAAESAWEQVAIRAEGPSVLRVGLAAPDPLFLDLLGYYPLYPVHRGSLEEARRRHPVHWQREWTRPGKLVSAGPYVLAGRRIRDRLRLEKNPHYWAADRIAFRTIDALAVDHWGTALNLYLTGEIDWLDGTVPNGMVARLAGREDFRPAPYLGVYFYRVNCTKPPLDDARVRRALAMTINRRMICNLVLKAGQQPAFTAVAWGRIGDYVSPQVLDTDLGAALDLLAQAGFGEGGRPFPPLEIHYNTSESHRDIAEVISDGWRRALGIRTRLLNQEWKVYLSTQSSLGYDLSRSSWIADYADPMTFLDIWVSDGPNNKTGWSHKTYDALIARAKTETSREARNWLLREAERILLQEAPLLPVYSYVSQNLINPRLGGFGKNALNDQSLGFFYWMDDAELAARRAQQPQEWTLVDAPGPSEGLYPPVATKARQEERDRQEAMPAEAQAEAAR